MDGAHVNALRHEFERLAAAGADVIVDLACTENIDGSGVGAIVYTAKRLAAGDNRLTIRNANGQPHALLSAAGLLRTLGPERSESRIFAAVRRALSASLSRALASVQDTPERQPTPAARTAPHVVVGTGRNRA